MLAADLAKGEELRERVTALVRDKATAEKLKAWYYLHCKRPCFHDEYLDAFNRPNVTLVDTAGKTQRIEGNAMIVDEERVELDCLVFATGFEVATSYASQNGYDPVGRGGIRLSQRWAQHPRTLYGMQAAAFPNMFFTGYVQNAATQNFTHTLAEQAAHIAYITTQTRDRGFRTVEATEEAEQEWLAEMMSYATDASRERWERCTPGYYNGEGEDNAFGWTARRYGGGPVKFFALLDAWRRSGELSGVRL